MFIKLSGKTITSSDKKKQMALNYIDHSIYHYSTHVVQHLNSKVISYHKEPYDDMINS